MTQAMEDALAWLKEHGGTGVFTSRRNKNPRNVYLLAAGEWAPFMPSTWKRLAEIGSVRIADSRVTVAE